MSQVRKFEKGGNSADSTPKSKHNSKYGHYIVDGTTYDVNDDFIRDYIESAKQFGDNSTNTVASYVINALKSGQDVSLDTLNNRVYGINGYLNSNDVEKSNEYSQNPLSKRYQRKYRRKEARPNSSLHQLNTGISNLGSIRFTDPIEEPVQKTISQTTPQTISESVTEPVQETTQQEETPQVTPRSYEGSGFDNSALEQAGYWVVRGDDGHTYLKDNNGNLVTTPWFLKGDPLFANSIWNNGLLVNGRFYTQNEALNQNTDATPIMQAWINAQRSTNDPTELWNALKATGIRFYGSEAETNPWAVDSYNASKQTIAGFDNLLTNGDYYIHDWTSRYDNLPEGSRIISFLNENNSRDFDYSLNPYFAISNPNNPESARIFESQEALQNYLNEIGVTERQGVTYSSPLAMRDWKTGPNGEKMELVKTVPFSEDGEQDANIFRAPDGNYYTEGVNGNWILLQGENIMQKILNGTVSHQELLNGYANEDVRKFWGKDGKIFGIINMGTKNKNPYTPGAYDKYFGFKNGGKIPILQYGGAFAKPSNVKSYKASEDKVGQSQRVLSNDKKAKTSADRLATMAGMLDIGGAGATLIPGVGNIVGTITGLAGSALKFASDVQRDGLDWNDAKRLAGNVGLDLLSLLPIVGTGAKAAKVTKGASTAVKTAKGTNLLEKGIKAVTTNRAVTETLRKASPVLSATSTGVGLSGVVNYLSDEDKTAEDFAQFGQNVAAGIYGLKGVTNAFKRASAVKSLLKEKPDVPDKFKTEKVAENAKAGEKAKTTASNTAKNAGNWLNRKAQEAKYNLSNAGSSLSLMWKPGKQDVLLLDAIKNNSIKLPETLSPNQQQVLGEFLTRNGAYLHKENSVLVPEIISMWRNKYKLNELELPKTKGLLPANNGSTNKIGKIQYIGTKTNISSPKYSTDKIIDQPFVQALPINPKELPDYSPINFGGPKLLPEWNPSKGTQLSLFKKGGIIKAQNGKRLSIGYVSNANDSGISGFPSSAGMIWQYPTSKPEYNWYQSNPNGDTTPYAPSFHFMSEITPTINGGEINPAIVTAAKPQQTDWKTLTSNLFGGISKPDLSQYDTSVPEETLAPWEILADSPEYQKVSSSIQAMNNPVQVTDLKQATKQTTKSDGVGSQKLERRNVLSGLNINPDDVIGTLDLFRNLSANIRMYNSLKDANRSILKEMPTEIYDRYQDHITPVYQEAARNKRQFFVPTSSDAALNYAVRQANEDQAQQLETEGRLKASEAYSQYLDKDLAARRAYAQQRQDTAFYNRQEMANKVMRDAQIDQAKALANNQSISNWVMEMRNKISQDRTKSQAFQQRQDSLLAQQKANEVLNNAAQEWRDKFADLPEGHNYSDYLDLWIRTDPDSYSAIQTNAQLAAQDYLQNQQNKYIDYWFNNVPIVSLAQRPSPSMTGYRSFKKGGKTSYRKLHTGQKPDEAIWIQRNKDTAKALEKLHDAVIKLFMKSIF